MGGSKEEAKYALEIKKSALKELADLPSKVSLRISNAIDKLVDNPFPKGVEKLKGIENTYRIRIGDYRVVYRIAVREKTISVERIRHRKEVYR